MKKKTFSTFIIPAIVGVLILSATLAIFFQFSYFQNQLKESNKEKFVTVIENTISRREGRIETIATGIIAFYANSEKVQPYEFDNFVKLILGENPEITNVFTLVNNTITQSFPNKEYIGKDFDETFSSYPTEVSGKKVMTVDFAISDELILVIAVPFDYFVQEGVIPSNNYKLVLQSPIDNNVELYKIENTNGKINYDFTFTQNELLEAVRIDHQTELFGHKIKQNYNLKYLIWDSSFTGQFFEISIFLGIGIILSVVIPVLLIRSNLLKNLLREKSETLERLNQELINVEKSKDEFVTMIVHDLKNPLVPIQAYAEILLTQTFGNLNEKQIQRLQSIKDNALALQKMIQDLLDANKLELGKLKLDVKSHNLTKIIKSELDSLDSEFQKKGITVSFEPREDVYCECDGSRIRQVINNVLLNAIDFVSEKTGKIEITLKVENNIAKIFIKDNGIGVPKDKIDSLFVKFYQIGPTTHRKYGGTGLGLSICKGIIENHKGRIWAESEGEGKGTQICIEIPLKYT
ncbi:MAG TPA: HAMP domain-containing sensor histidine kinase [Candidatus Nitrosotenuis sp.]|nr:HAMP domain-containing sensor histidine kinase [Candidatus Nitrosotenuis sp.]